MDTISRYSTDIKQQSQDRRKDKDHAYFANNGPLEVNLLALKTMLPFLVCALIKSEAACAPRENANGWRRGWEKTI